MGPQLYHKAPRPTFETSQPPRPLAVERAGSPWSAANARQLTGRRGAQDQLKVDKAGRADWDTGFKPFTRSYLPIAEGPLRRRLGSPPPASTALTPSEQAQVRARTPGQSLNAAARELGVSLPDMDALFNSPRLFNPRAAYWEGSCHSWTELSLSPRLDALVDVDGAQGARGSWYRGEFFSRAELGNLAMALGDTIASNPAAREMGDVLVTALDVLKAAQAFLGDRKAGFQLDVWNDVARGAAQVWNQPSYAGSLESKRLEGPAADALVEVASTDPFISDKSSLGACSATVRRLALRLDYGKEVRDDWEGAPGTESRTWNMYAVVDPDGLVLQAYNADDPRLSRLGLPTHESAELPDFIVKPDLSFVDDALDGRPNAVVDRDPNGPAFRFLVGEVMTRGVPAERRTAFEREVAGLPVGAIEPARAAEDRAAGLPAAGRRRARSGEQLVRRAVEDVGVCD